MADLIKMFYNEKGDRIYPKTTMSNVVGDAPLDTDCSNITINGKKKAVRQMTPRSGTQSYSAPASGSSITLPANGYLTVAYRSNGNSWTAGGLSLYNQTSGIEFTGNEGASNTNYTWYVTAWGRKGDKIQFIYANLSGIDSVVFTYAGEVS